MANLIAKRCKRSFPSRERMAGAKRGWWAGVTPVATTTPQRGKRVKREGGAA